LTYLSVETVFIKAVAIVGVNVPTTSGKNTENNEPLLDVCEVKMRKKPKKKDRGKKRYKSTNGNWHRVKLGFKLRRRIQQRKMLRKLKK
jgi:hypothetical protein